MLGNDRSTAVILSAFKNFYSEKRKSFRDGKNFDEKQKTGLQNQKNYAIIFRNKTCSKE
jgi:hypothetical protein